MKRISVPEFSIKNGFKTTPERSRIMASIKSNETKAERTLRRKLWETGLRYRKNVKNIPGTPDIVFLRAKLIVFIDGEFWHGKDWKHQKEKLKKNREFWIKKIERNIQRDREITKLLSKNGWQIVRFWEKEVLKDCDKCVTGIQELLKKIDEQRKY